MRKRTPRFPTHSESRPLSPPTVAEIIERSPGVREKGALKTAWNLVANLDFRDSDLLLAVAIGCLCRKTAELEAITKGGSYGVSFDSVREIPTRLKTGT